MTNEWQKCPPQLSVFIFFIKEQNDIVSNMKDLLKLIDYRREKNIPRLNNNIERY